MRTRGATSAASESTGPALRLAVGRGAHLANASRCLAVARKPHLAEAPVRSFARHSRCDCSANVHLGPSPRWFAMFRLARLVGLGRRARTWRWRTRDMTNLQINRMGWPGNLAALAVRDPPAVEIRQQTKERLLLGEPLEVSGAAREPEAAPSRLELTRRDGSNELVQDAYRAGRWRVLLLIAERSPAVQRVLRRVARPPEHHQRLCDVTGRITRPHRWSITCDRA
jgi:hypothetical protein